MCISRKVRIVQALLLGVPFFFAGCTSPSKPQLSADAQAEALSHFSLGLLAETGGDSSSALGHLEEALRLDPNEEKLYAPSIAIALKLAQTNDAVRLAQKVAELHPDSFDARLLLARVYALTDQPGRAEALFRKIRTDFPDNPNAWLFLAQFYISQNRRAEALETLRISISRQNVTSDLFHLLGTLCVDSARNMSDSQKAQKTVLEGIDFLRRALELEPENPAVWQQLGFALLSVKKQDEALTAIQAAHSCAPDDSVLARQMFDLLIQTGNYEKAMESCESLAEETGTPPEAWFQYLAEKLPEDEIPRLTGYLETRIREQPQAEIFYYAQLGALYIGAKENEKAETVLTGALEQYPSDNRLRIVLGYLHLQQERFDDAYAELEQVRTESSREEWSSNPFFLFNFLVAAQKSAHLEEAANTLSATYTNNPAVLNQYMLSLLTEKSPVSTENAIELLNVFHKQSPEAAEALYYLALLQADQKEYQKAIQSAQQFEKLAQSSGQTHLLSGEFYYQYAALYERTGQLETAEKQFFKAIDLGDERIAASSQNYIAYMWAERGEKLDQGLALVQKALSAEPENGAFLDTLGWIYYMQGRYANALNELKKAQKSVQVDPAVWEHLGDTYQKMGNVDEASKHWKKALELDPKSQKLIDRLKENGFTTDSSPAPTDSPADTMPRP